MPAIALAMQRLPVRRTAVILVALFLAVAAVVTIIAAAFHGVPITGHEAMSYGGKTNMSYG